MWTLTTAQFWGMWLGIVAADAVIVAGFLSHWSGVSKDILRDEKQKLEAQARQHAAQRANELFREYVAHIRINVPVRLVNESDIRWNNDDQEE